MVDFTEDQIEDIKDGFDLYDRKGSKHYVLQVFERVNKWIP